MPVRCPGGAITVSRVAAPWLLRLPGRALGSVTWATRVTRTVGTLAACLALAACGGAASGAPPPDGSSPTPQPAGPPALTLNYNDSFKASVEQQMTTQSVLTGSGDAPLTTQLAVTARQTLRVTSLKDGIADLEVTTTSWDWGPGASTDPVGSLPEPWHVRVGPDGVIVSGSYWSMPQDPPLPGMDYFSSGLPPPGGPWSASWKRVLQDGTPLVCQAQGGQPYETGDGTTVDTTVECTVTRRGSTPDGSPELVQGDVKAAVSSTFDLGRGRVLTTSYNTSFAENDTTPQGTMATTGAVTTRIRFTY